MKKNLLNLLEKTYENYNFGKHIVIDSENPWFYLEDGDHYCKEISYTSNKIKENTQLSALLTVFFDENILLGTVCIDLDNGLIVGNE